MGRPPFSRGAAPSPYTPVEPVPGPGKRRVDRGTVPAPLAGGGFAVRPGPPGGPRPGLLRRAAGRRSCSLAADAASCCAARGLRRGPRSVGCEPPGPGWAGALGRAPPVSVDSGQVVRTRAGTGRCPVGLGRVSKVAPSARRAGAAASGAVHRKAEGRPRTGRTRTIPTTRRGAVPGVAGQAGLSKHALVPGPGPASATGWWTCRGSDPGQAPRLPAAPSGRGREPGGRGPAGSGQPRAWPGSSTLAPSSMSFSMKFS